MKRLLKYEIIILALAMFTLTACSQTDVDIEVTIAPPTATQAMTVSPVAIPTVSPTQEPTASLTQLPTVTPLPTPTLSLTPTPENPGINSITLVTPKGSLDISNNPFVSYSGPVNLVITFNTGINKDITNFISINYEQIESPRLLIQGNVITVTLDETLPEYFTFSINESAPGNPTSLKESYKINFTKKATLTYSIVLADPLMLSLPEKPIYLATPSQSFRYTFSKPVLEESLNFPSFMDDYNLTIDWLNDREMLLTVKDLSLWSHRVGLDYIKGTAPEFGNEIIYDQAAAKPDSCIYRINIIEQQKLFAFNPENNELKTLYEFDYGTVFEDISPPGKYLSVGIVTNEMEGYSYAKTWLNIETSEITVLDNFISSSVSKALNTEIATHASGFYNPITENKFWDNDGNYHIFFGNSIFNIDPDTHEAVIRVSDPETNRVPYPLFHLNNGGIAAVKTPSTETDCSLSGF